MRLGGSSGNVEQQKEDQVEYSICDFDYVKMRICGYDVEVTIFGSLPRQKIPPVL